MAPWRRVLVLLALGVLFGAQVIALVYARTGDTRYLAWAPYDQISLYQVEVTQGGVGLEASEVARRYPLGLWVDEGQARGRENRSIAHVYHLIDRVEKRWDSSDIVVVVRSTVNGVAQEPWSWPQP